LVAKYVASKALNHETYLRYRPSGIKLS